MTIHPVGQTRAHPAKRDDRASIKFVDPHFIFEESKQLGLRQFERISVGGTLSILHAGFAIHPDAQSEARVQNGPIEETIAAPQLLPPRSSKAAAALRTHDDVCPALPAAR